MRIILILSILLSAGRCMQAQDTKVSCTSGEIIAQNGNKSHFRSVVNLPYEDLACHDIPENIRDNAILYLTDRVGKDFMQELMLYKCGEIFYDRAEVIRKEKPWTRESTDQRIKYYLEYYFDLEHNLKYYFTLTYDEEGKMISDHQVPDRRINPNFADIMPICEAVIIAERDSILPGVVHWASLEYSDSISSFVWSMQKSSVEGSKPSEFYERYILIDAITGEYVARPSLFGWGIIHDDMPPFPKLNNK